MAGKEKASGKLPAESLMRVSARVGRPVASEAGRKRGAPDVRSAVFHAAERTVEFYDHLRAHYREARRMTTAVPAAVRLVLDDGSVFDSGSAVVRNLSPSGALLCDIRLPKGCYPAQHFKIEIVMQGGKYKGIGLEALPVRFHDKDQGLGVRFQEIFVALEE